MDSESIEKGYNSTWFGQTVWPMNVPEQISGFLEEEGGIEVLLHPDSTLTINRLDQRGRSEIFFRSQPIQPTGKGEILIVADWDGDFGAMKVSGVRLSPYSESAQAVKVPVRPHPPEPGPAIDAPDIEQLCLTWIDNRKAKFTAPNILQGRREKTIQEQARELSESLQLLDAFNEYSKTDAVYLSPLATLLRALVSWRLDRKREALSSPLLFRLASKIDLPLPVNARDPDLTAPPKLVIPASSLRPRNEPVFDQVPVGYSVMDIQEYLLQTAVTTLAPAADGSLVPTDMSRRDLIRDYANTLGIAHFDEDWPEVTYITKRQITGNRELCAYYLLKIADHVAELGHWVLEKLQCVGSSICHFDRTGQVCCRIALTSEG